jgi:hypothetical protein
MQIDMVTASRTTFMARTPATAAATQTATFFSSLVNIGAA